MSDIEFPADLPTASSPVNRRAGHRPAWLKIRVPGDLSVSPGEAFTAPVPPQHSHLFDADGIAFVRPWA